MTALERWEARTAVDVVAALERARDWLRDQTSIPVVQDGIALGEALQAVARQRDLGHDAELAAAEIVRRAERRLAELVAEGQARGDIATLSSAAYARENDHEDGAPSACLPKARDIFGGVDLQKHARRFAAVNEDDWNEALDACRTEGAMSRAAVTRHLQRDAIVRPRYRPDEDEAWNYRRRRIDPNRVVRKTVLMLEGLASGLASIDATDVDDPDRDAWARSLTESITILSQLRKDLAHE